MPQLFTNNAESTLAVSANASGTSLTVASGQGAIFPSPSGGDFFMATLTQAGAAETTWEIVRVLSRSGDTFTAVDRGMEGTTPAAWASGSKCELRLTAGVLWPLASSTSGNLTASRVTVTAAQVVYGNASNAATGSTLLTWDDANKTLTLGAGNGPSRLFTANAVSGAGASSLTIKTGDANSGVVGAGLLTVQGGSGAGASAAGNVVVSGGDHPSTGTAGSVTISGGNSSGGANGSVVLETRGIARLTVAADGNASASGNVSVGAALAVTGAASVGGTLTGNVGTFSGALQGTALRVTGSTAPDNGMFLDAAGVVGLSANSTEAYLYGSNAFASQTDNTRDLGVATTLRWRNLYIVNSPTVGSDARWKTDIRTTELGLDFVLGLRPVSCRLIEGTKLVSDDGLNTVTSVAGTRRHHMFVAQDVQRVLADRGMDGSTFAGWCLADKDDPDSMQMLRYEQFIPPIVKALQELHAKVLDLETQLKELKP